MPHHGCAAERCSQIIPGILPAGRIGWHHRESVQHDGEVELGGCSVEWLQCWVVERHADWRVDHQPPGPVGAAPAADLNKGPIYVSGAGQDYAAEPVRVSAAIF